jgi:predicted DNA-binding transcriptional regulator YafY
VNVADANLLQPKTKRQRAILALIAARPDAFAGRAGGMLLEQQGYEVTQATISRDIKELGLMKVPLKGGAGGSVQVRRAESVGPDVLLAAAPHGRRARRRAFAAASTRSFCEPHRAAR